MTNEELAPAAPTKLDELFRAFGEVELELLDLAQFNMLIFHAKDSSNQIEGDVLRSINCVIDRHHIALEKGFAVMHQLCGELLLDNTAITGGWRK